MSAEKIRLEELRAAIRAENISYGELHELQTLTAHIEPGDVELLEWAGVPEHPEDTIDPRMCCKYHPAIPATHIAGQNTGGDEDVPATWVPICGQHLAHWHRELDDDELRLPIFPIAEHPLHESEERLNADG